MSESSDPPARLQLETPCLRPRRSTTSSRVPLVGVVAALVGVALLVATIRQVGWAEIQQGVGAVGAWFVVVVLLGGAALLRAREVVDPLRRPDRRARPHARRGLRRGAGRRRGRQSDAARPAGLGAHQGAARAAHAGHRPGAHVGGARQRLPHRGGARDDRGRRLGARAPGGARSDDPPGRRRRARPRCSWPWSSAAGWRCAGRPSCRAWRSSRPGSSAARRARPTSCATSRRASTACSAGRAAALWAAAGWQVAFHLAPFSRCG